MKTKSKIIWLSSLLLLVLIVGFFYRQGYILRKNQAEVPENKSEVEIPVDLQVVATTTESISENIENETTTPPTVAPLSESSAAPWRSASDFDLKVAFASQAPLRNWDEPYQNACEEASAIMAARYFLNQNLDAEIMDQEIKKLVTWEIAEFGYYEDTPLSQIEIILEKHFKIKAEIMTDATVDKIKQALWRGNLILVPAAGQRLNNPNFIAPGPIYHVLIIRGWQGDKFITNDPGTRKGNGYKYQYENLMNAIFDPPIGGTTMTIETLEQGQKSVLIVGPTL